MVMGGHSVNHFGHYCVSNSLGHYNGLEHMGGGVVPSSNRSFSHHPSHLPMAVDSHHLPMVVGSHHLPLVAGSHGVSQYEYPTIAPACMMCMHCQPQHLPHPQMPSCALCYNQSLSMAHQHGYHHHTHIPHREAIPAFDAQGRAIMLKPQITKLSHYPPLPLPQSHTAPYFMCKGCNHLLHVPEGLNPIRGTTQKLRCGECGKVSKFSVCNEVTWRLNGGLKQSAMDATKEALTSASSSAHPNRLSSQPSFVSLTQRSMDYQGSIPIHHKLPHQSSGRLNSSSHSSHAEKLVESHARRRGLDSSSQLSFEFKAPPYRLEADSFGNGGLSSRFSSFLQTTVDEKDEGLDYGAPRMSDGDSLDQRSPESRRRSPENRKAFPPVKEDILMEAGIDSGVIGQAVGSSLRHPSFGRLQQNDPCVKRTLIALLNQESTKFEINFEERGSLALDSPGMQLDELGSMGDKRPVKGVSVPRGLSSQNYLRKGPRFMVGLMRRSLKDFGKGDSVKPAHKKLL